MSVHAKLFAILILFIPTAVLADEDVESETGTVKVVTADRLRELIKDLDADRYSIRQAATKELSAAGEAAIPLLVDTAKKASAEAAARCIQILEEHLQGDDESARAAAKKSLRDLADTGKESTSRLAKKALGEEVAELELEEELEDPFTPLPQGNQIGGGRFQIQLMCGNDGCQ